MNTKPFHTINSLHDKIAEEEQAYQSALDKDKDHRLTKSLKDRIDALKNELKQLEISFHDEFKNCSIKFRTMK